MVGHKHDPSYPFADWNFQHVPAFNYEVSEVVVWDTAVAGCLNAGIAHTGSLGAFAS